MRSMQIATVLCGGPGLELPVSHFDNCGPAIKFENTTNSLTPCQAYELIRKSVAPSIDIICYCHDDLSIHDLDWQPRLLSVFESHPNCVCAGLGGAPRLGSEHLYKRSYRIHDLARAGYVSNQTDWKTHGGHETGERRVAVVDAFLMAIRTDFLQEVGGWPVEHLTHHLLDLWIACEAARRGHEVWMTGIKCTHHGGGTSTKKVYESAKWLVGGTLESDHQLPHKWLYEEYRDVLPLRIDS